jgi:ATP-binding cassette subfamily C protein
MFAVASIRLLPSANRLAANLTNLRFHLPSLDIIREELQALREIPNIERTLQRGESAGRLELQRALVLRDVSYCYPGADRHAIDAVSLTIPRGSLVAFIGPTAAGKTTLIDLILGLLSPSRGAVLVDGHDIFGNLRAWQRTVGYVPQQIYMIDDSIRRNVAYATEDADIDDARVWSSLDSAEIGDVVRALPDGLDTLTGEDGARLSGGERQRLGIARALYADADILVMDEVTASLDGATEKKLVDTLVSLRGNRTIVMTAHRIPLMRVCDGLFLLRDGRIVASGTYQQLRETSREFQELIAA